MGKGVGRLSALVIGRKLSRGYHADGGGLYLQVGHGNSKSWVFRYRVRKPSTDAGRLREMGLGSFNILTLVEAREAARLCRKQLLEGDDPIKAREAGKLAMLQKAASEAAQAKTFDECAEAYLESHKASWRNEKHKAQWDATLAMYVSRCSGKSLVAAIEVNLVMKVLDPIWQTKRETARRVRGRIEAILDWATVRGYRRGENPARWKGCIEQLVPAHKKLGPPTHHAALPYPELPAFVRALRVQDGISAAALEFAILTASRTNEVLRTRWAEIDLAQRLWDFAC